MREKYLKQLDYVQTKDSYKIRQEQTINRITDVNE